MCEKGGGRKLTQIVFSHFHNIIGFKVTMTVLHVCAFAFPALYMCTFMWLPIWWNRQRGMKINCKVAQPFQSWVPEGMLAHRPF